MMGKKGKVGKVGLVLGSSLFYVFIAVKGLVCVQCLASAAPRHQGLASTDI